MHYLCVLFVYDKSKLSFANTELKAKAVESQAPRVKAQLT